MPAKGVTHHAVLQLQALIHENIHSDHEAKHTLSALVSAFSDILRQVTDHQNPALQALVAEFAAHIEMRDPPAFQRLHREFSHFFSDPPPHAHRNTEMPSASALMPTKADHSHATDHAAPLTEALLMRETSEPKRRAAPPPPADPKRAYKEAMRSLWSNAVPGSAVHVKATTEALSDRSGFEITTTATWLDSTGRESFHLEQTFSERTLDDKKKSVTLEIESAHVADHLQGKGLCAALMGDQADALKKLYGPTAEINIILLASGFKGQQIGRVFWGKLGAVFAAPEDRTAFLACCRTWLSGLPDTELPPALKTHLMTMWDDTHVDITTGIAIITAPWILFSFVEEIDKQRGGHKPALMQSLANHIMSDAGVAWNGIIRIQPEPENGSPFALRVTAARAKRAEMH